MAEQPIDPTSPQDQRSAAQKLAERYGISVDEMEKLIASGKDETAQRPTAGKASLPPIPANTPTPAIEEAASRIATTSTSRQTTTKGSLNTGLIAALITAVVIGVGVAMSFKEGCFHQRTQHVVIAKVDSIPAMLEAQADSASTPPETPSQVPSGQVPPEALAAPQESPAGTTGPPPPRSVLGKEQIDAGTATTSSSSPVETSSNIDAQEKLAEMRAAGNPKARVVTSHRHGTTIYRVVPK